MLSNKSLLNQELSRLESKLDGKNYKIYRTGNSYLFDILSHGKDVIRFIFYLHTLDGKKKIGIHIPLDYKVTNLEGKFDDSCENFERFLLGI